MMESEIRLFITGGTIDVDHIAADKSYCFKESFLPAMLLEARSKAEVQLETLFLKDSLHMTEEDRAQIVEACHNCAENRILISHGTDSMPETARTLGAGVLAKTIVLFGAAIPYVKPPSDALFNLGFALAAAQCASPGVFVAMNGQVWPWDTVHKNKLLGVFEQN